MIGQSAECVLGILGVVSVLILLWIIIIHLRLNKIKDEIESLKEMTEK